MALTATRLSVENGIATFKVDDIKFTQEKVEEPAVEEVIVEEPEEEPDLNKLKKAELINIAQEIGHDVSAKMTKKELIELIEGK